MPWRYLRTEPHIAVVYPEDDILAHDVDGEDECVCGPKVEPFPARDGSMCWIYIHNSLDGREYREQPRRQENQ
jgi:hypothetical protein